MTTTEPLFRRAESASRRVLLVVCAGALAWFVGALISVNLHELMVEPLEAVIETGLGLIVEHWVFQHAWLLLTLAPTSYAAGRFLGGPALHFVLPAAVSGEFFELSFAFLRDGSPFDSWADVAGWAVSFVVFLSVSLLTFRRGSVAFERSQLASVASAADRQAEYDAFVERSKRGDG